MKNFIFLLFLPALLFAQPAVKTVPNSHQSQQILNTTINAGSATSDAVSIKYWSGAGTLFLYLNASGATQDLTVEFQLYDSQADQWFGYYSDSDDWTDLATIGSAKLAGKYVYIDCGEITGWANADSIRFKFTFNEAINLTVQAWFGGQ